MAQTKFTINEIRNYIEGEDSRGDISYNLSAENIIKANEKDPIKVYIEWLINAFNEVTTDIMNGEEMTDVDIELTDDKIKINYIVDAGRAAIHKRGNTIYIEKKDGYSDVSVCICEMLEDSGIEEGLEEKIKGNLKQLFELEL